MLSKAPHLVKEKDNEGNNIAHYAAGGSLKKLEIILKGYPDLAEERNQKGELPIDCAIKMQKWEEVSYIVDNGYHPAGIKDKITAHLESLSRYTAKYFTELISAKYPNLLKIKNNEEKLFPEVLEDPITSPLEALTLKNEVPLSVPVDKNEITNLGDTLKYHEND